MSWSDRVSIFFDGLSRSHEGREIFSEGDEAFHIRIGADQGVLISVAAQGVRTSTAAPEMDPSEEVTRLAVPDERTLERILSGVTSFWEAVIPMGEEHGAVLFVDNWMLKKGSINRFGRMVRTTQEVQGKKHHD